MIAKIIIPLLLMILLPDMYIYLHHVRTKARLPMRLLWWLPSLSLAVYTVGMGCLRDFAPKDNTLLDTYLFLLGLVAMPKLVFAVSSSVGMGLRRVFRMRRNYGTYAGAVIAAGCLYILFYGSFIGFHKLDVRHVDYYSEMLPASFDGYTIVQFSDAHVGTYGRKHTGQLSRAIDSINARRPDMIVFTGDLQNMHPREIRPHMPVLGRLKAPDGVFSVLGNHDYADYISAPDSIKAANERETAELQGRMGWTLLRNESRVIRRGADSIVIAGMENDGDGRHFPRKGDIGKTLAGVSDSAFTVMLEHDPTSWRSRILPHSNAALTLSGHTHAMQFELFGWSPVAFKYSEWGGIYHEGTRAINVSTGLGGFIPFRFGIPGEIVVITLHRGTKQSD